MPVRLVAFPTSLVVGLALPALAAATIVPNQGLAGVRLGMTKPGTDWFL